MTNLSYSVLLTVIITLIVISKSNESEDLIEKCPPPWAPYNTRVSTSECRNKCEGKAFHTKEGKLICFHVKDISCPKPHSGPRPSSTKIVTCKCGYSIPSTRSKWLPCENDYVETTSGVCEEICKTTTVYLYQRAQLMRVLFCENYKRSEFYDMVGHTGEMIYYENSWNAKHRECTCGITSMELKPIITTVVKASNLVVSFQQCSKPWETSELRISVLKTCKIHCQLICKRGFGIIHNGEAFCFKRKAKAKKRTSFHGAVEGACDCGYIKKNNEIRTREYIPCDPPITKNGILGRECDLFCSKSTIYIYQKFGHQLNIRCIYKPQMKPETLIGKCDKRIYQRETNNATRKYTKCSCGLGKSLDDQILKKKIELASNEGFKLPDSWSVKKKRSMRSHGKYKEQNVKR